MTATIVNASPVAYQAVVDAAERRLWGGTSYVPNVGNRHSVASGTTLVVPGETSVTVAEHDTSRFSDGEYGIERYLI